MDADVLIIGGGIAGLSLAWRLAPQLSVVVVEAEPTLAFHTSSRSARQMQPSYGPAPIQELTRRSIKMVGEISASLPAPILKPRPLLTLGTAEEVAALVAGNANLVALSHGETMRRSPDLRADRFEASALDETAMEVDVPALLEFYRSQAVASGATVLTDARLTDARLTDARLTDARLTVAPVLSANKGSAVSKGSAATPSSPAIHNGAATKNSAGFEVVAGAHTIRAAVVVNAAGAWADQVAGLFDVRPRGLVPHRRSVAIVSTAVPVNPAGPMVDPADESFYYRPDGENLLISPCESVPAEPGNAQVVDADIAELIHRIDAVTTLGITGVVRSWTGLRTHPADGLPVVGFDADARAEVRADAGGVGAESGVPNFFWLAGQGGYGIQTSAALATFAAGLITKKFSSSEVIAAKLARSEFEERDAELAAALSPQRPGLGSPKRVRRGIWAS